MKTDVLILNFNRVASLEKLVTWLFSLDDISRIRIMDNASSYPPVFELYAKYPKLDIIRNKTNGSHKTPKAFLEKYYTNKPVIMSDPDMYPADYCPNDLISKLHYFLNKHRDTSKAGPNLRTDDLPDCFPRKKEITAIEKGCLLRDNHDGSYMAVLDTTFALYRSGLHFGSIRQAIRLTHPYHFIHPDWYINPANLDEEYKNYLKTSNKFASNAERMRSWIETENKLSKSRAVLHEWGKS